MTRRQNKCESEVDESFENENIEVKIQKLKIQIVIYIGWIWCAVII